MKCLEIARLQDFAPNTQGLLGALSGPPYQTNPPLKISAYGPDVYIAHINEAQCFNHLERMGYPLVDGALPCTPQQ